jgi:hypothetical protein
VVGQSQLSTLRTDSVIVRATALAIEPEGGHQQWKRHMSSIAARGIVFLSWTQHMRSETAPLLLLLHSTEHTYLAIVLGAFLPRQKPRKGLGTLYAGLGTPHAVEQAIEEVGIGKVRAGGLWHEEALEMLL